MLNQRSIHLLPEEVASQIAAGEVVDRPASVVKELIENSIDANASIINLRVEGAGHRLIEIGDDGIGIPGDELSLAVMRHATSKLQVTNDLSHISTLGFRGEALAAIGSVSRMHIVSRTRDIQIGAELSVDGGTIGIVRPVSSPEGTLIQIEDLFYNVPARRKFLKKESTERRQIETITAHYALAYPDIRFRLLQDNHLVLQTSGNGNKREAISFLYGADIARQMLEMIFSEEEISINGFISPTSINRSNRNDIIFFVNRRPVHDSALTAGILQAYHTMLMVGRYPIASIFIEIDPGLVDVNIHPTKAEVRFQEHDRVFSSIQRAVRRALLSYTPIPELGTEANWQGWNTPSSEVIDPAWQMSIPAKESMTEADIPHSIFNPVQEHEQPELTHVHLLRPIGQAAGAYLIAEAPDGLYLIDQHAAHERVLFERFMNQRNEVISAQSLLEPISVELSLNDSRLLEEQINTINHLGFEVEHFGRNTFLVRAIPSILSNINPDAALRVLVEDFEEDETPLGGEIEARLIARVCKRAAVKAGQILTPEEQIALIHDLETCRSPRTCPHGRPTMIHLSMNLLERQFGRKGAK